MVNVFHHLSSFKGDPSEGTSWSENEVLKFLSAGFVWLFYQYLCNRSRFGGEGLGGAGGSNLSSLGHSHVGSLFTNEDHGKSWLMTTDTIMLVPHMPA